MSNQMPPQWKMEIYEMRHVKGMSMKDISVALEKEGIQKSAGVVASICRDVDNFLKVHFIDNIERVRARHHTRLERIFFEAMSAWYGSQKPSKELETISGRDPEGKGGALDGKVKKRRLVKSATGEAKFLETALKALADQRKMWGVDAPTRHAHTGEDGGPIKHAVQVQHMSDEDVEVLAEAHKVYERMNQASPN